MRVKTQTFTLTFACPNCLMSPEYILTPTPPPEMYLGGGGDITIEYICRLLIEEYRC